jgi:hypothetical protein
MIAVNKNNCYAVLFSLAAVMTIIPIINASTTQ